MTKRAVVALLLVALTLPLDAGGFREIARAIDAQRGVKRVWIPFLSVARFATHVVQPKGVHDFQLAVFEGGENVDALALHRLLRETIGKDFTPLVQVWSRKKSGRREWSFIYARPHGENRVELFILAHDAEDTALVRVDVNADVLARELDEPRNVTRMARR